MEFELLLRELKFKIRVIALIFISLLILNIFIKLTKLLSLIGVRVNSHNNILKS